MRKLLAHEALIVAINDIWNNDPPVHENGVDSQRLKEHDQTRDLTDGQLATAVEQARRARWLLGIGPGIHRDLGGSWSGLGLSNDGLAKVAELTRPLWSVLLAALAGDLRTIIIGAISGGIGGVIAGVVIVLLVD